MKEEEKVKERKVAEGTPQEEPGKGSLKVDRRAGVWLYVVAALLVLGLVSNVVRIVVSGHDEGGEKTLGNEIRELGKAVKGSFVLGTDSLGTADTSAVAGVDSLSAGEDKVNEK